jgi:Domain of unknown function (DUF222)
VTEDPFPARGDDGEEPEDSCLLPSGEDGSGGLPEGAGQGLYVTLPAEELTLAGFAQGGRADTMAPGPLMAAVVHAVAGEDGAGLKALSDDQLIGVISAARRLEARATWTQLAATAEFAARHPAAGARPGPGVSEFAADELAAEFRQPWTSAAGQVDYAQAVATRLPATFAALAAGLIHPVHLRIIEDETRILNDHDVAAADGQLAEAARDRSFGQLRCFARRLVLKLDPDAAARRTQAARREACVRRFREDSGNAGMIARELPGDEVLASWQHVEQRALDLRAAGMPGTLQELRVRAYLDLLTERDSRDVADDQAVAADGPAEQAARAQGPGGSGGPGGSRGLEPQLGPAGPSTGIACPAPADPGPSVATLVNITVPLATVLGASATPGEAAGFGLLDAADVRALIAAASRNPATRWCLTVLHPDGTAAAHGCAAGPSRWPPGPLIPKDFSAAQILSALNIKLTPVIRGPCDHAQAELRYRPSRKLRHRVTARNTRCTAPGCSRPAARCDLDHTQPWHQGGVTCECNLAPLCRHHHKCKQSEGWKLEHPEPGTLVWTTPAGRHYMTRPTVYAT